MIATENANEQAITRAMVTLGGYLENLIEQQVFVDPREAYRGPNGEDWIALTQTDPQDLTTSELDMIRRECRFLAKRSPWAINALKNRRNYVVGWGHIYTAVGRTEGADPRAVARVQAFLKFWTQTVKWGKRQRETLLRADRDGEVFIRKFPTDDGILHVRYVDPNSLRDPVGAGDNVSHGIETDEDDEETIEAYWVGRRGRDPERIDASEIQHRKFNVDAECRRGLSMLFAVRPNLMRADRLLRNMAATAEIHAAIAMIRKHKQATSQAIRSFLAAIEKARKDGRIDVADDNINRYPPGSVIDAGDEIEYQFPNAGVDPSKFVACLQADLRAVCSAWTMPEFMVTSDASNGNYASILVAEGPVTKAFEHDQQEMIEDDLEIVQAALDHAAEHGGHGITPADVEQVRIEVTPPPVASRNTLKDAQVTQILGGMGWLSPQSAMPWFGLKYEEERTNIEDAEEKAGGPITKDRPGLPPLPGAEV